MADARGERGDAVDRGDVDGLSTLIGADQEREVNGV
jgi:hypothetical protein